MLALNECLLSVTLLRGKETYVALPPDATVAALGAALERATGASLATQKILGLKLFKGTGTGASKGAAG